MGLYYKDGVLQLGETSFHSLAALAQKEPHPFYAYDLEAVLARYKKLLAAGSAKLKPHYAMKANSAAPILELFRKEGAGVDVVSGGELSLALRSGFHPKDIIFSGIGKTKAEITLAIEQGIGQINIESPAELIRIAELAQTLKKVPQIAFRINPDVDAKTHPYITTGFRENKFGMDESFLPELRKLLQQYKNQVKLVGITMHIGSQIRDLAPFRAAIQKTLPIFHAFRNEGHLMKTFDVGGGLGIPYETPHALPSPEIALIESYGKMLQEELSGLDAEILCEPGRILVASSGVLVGQVQYVKETPFKNFLICNTGIHHLIRPALYQAHHRILPLEENANRPLKTYDVVGPICESSDILGKARTMHEVYADEFIAIADAGAYGFTMASHYNEHELPKQYFFQKGGLV